MRPQRTKLSVEAGMDMDARSLTVKQDIENDLAEFERKPFGWNGEHSLPVRQDVVVEIRDRLLCRYGIDFRGLPTPTLYLHMDGTVYIVFNAAQKTMTVHVLCGSVIHCFAEQRDGEEFYCRDKLVKLAKGTPATGYAVEVDDWGDWLLGLD